MQKFKQLPGKAPGADRTSVSASWMIWMWHDRSGHQGQDAGTHEKQQCSLPSSHCWGQHSKKRSAWHVLFWMYLCDSFLHVNLWYLDVLGTWVTFQKTPQSILNVKATLVKLISWALSISTWTFDIIWRGYIHRQHIQTSRYPIDIFRKTTTGHARDTSSTSWFVESYQWTEPLPRTSDEDGREF